MMAAGLQDEYVAGGQMECFFFLVNGPMAAQNVNPIVKRDDTVGMNQAE